jgi:serine/threonine protein kinase
VSCVDDEDILLLASGHIDAAKRDALLLHLDTCDTCRELVADVLRDHVEAEGGRAIEAMVPILPRAGDTVGRYVLLEWIASGGMGMVFAAYDPQVDRRIAIKLMAPRMDERAAEELRGRLRREAVAMARVADRNVVAVYDVGRVEGSVFVAMEFVAGTTLARRESSASSWQETVALYLQAGRGLAAAHRSGIIHRDFKPENVLVDTHDRARVADFGLAAIVADSDSRESAQWRVAAPTSRENISRHGRVVGTTRFMAPEQAKGAASELSDQYSFGIALDLALARHGASVPEGIRTALGRATAEAESARFPDMSSLLRVLDSELRRNAGSDRISKLGIVVIGLGALFILLPYFVRWLVPAEMPLTPSRMAFLAAVEGGALGAVYRIRRSMWSASPTRQVLRITAVAFAVEMLVGFALSVDPAHRVSIIPLWLLLHGFAAAIGGVVLVAPELGVASPIVLVLYLLSCRYPSAQTMVLPLSGGFIGTALLLTLRRMGLATRDVNGPQDRDAG